MDLRDVRVFVFGTVHIAAGIECGEQQRDESRPSAREGAGHRVAREAQLGHRRLDPSPGRL